ncbi:hypothetical protein HDU99_002221 [Rhizoclosmatium hyalinum]|nr:hypothetical protein HDU99_002221 [Rhizoclosmatium hyalinum]
MSTFQIAGGVGAGAAAFMSGTTGIAIIASSGSAIGGGLTGYKMHKRTQGISEFEFVRLEEALVSILANKEKRKKARGSVKKEKEKEKEKKERVEVMWSSDGVEGTSGNDDRLVVLGDDVGQKGQAAVGKRVDMLQAVEHRRGSSSVSSVSSPMDRTSRESRDIGRELNAPILMATATPVTEEGASLKTSTGDGSASSPKPNVLITIAGWVGSLESRDDFTLPFSTLTPGVHGEQYALVWETQALIELGCAVRLLVSEVTGFLVQQGIQYFLLPVLMAGLMGPLWALKLTYMVDNPWGNGLTKAKKAGRILADTLINRVQGNRPVTLVGFSLGARVIYYCLLELASRGEAAFSIVEEAYLFGTPVMATNKEWRAISSVVSGRLVNGYLTNDYILSILYRASSAFLADVAGLFPVQNVEGIENYCLDTVLKGGGHLEYRSAMPRILKHVGFSVDDEFFDDGEKEAEQERLDMEAEKERVKNDNERAKEEAAKKKQAEYEERLKKKREEEEARKAEAAAAPKRSWFGGWGSSSSSTGSLDNVAKVAKGDEAVFEVKEIKSTLPPLVLTLDGSATFPQESSPYNDDGSLI